MNRLKRRSQVDSSIESLETLIKESQHVKITQNVKKIKLQRDLELCKVAQHERIKGQYLDKFVALFTLLALILDNFYHYRAYAQLNDLCDIKGWKYCKHDVFWKRYDHVNFDLMKILMMALSFVSLIFYFAKRFHIKYMKLQ